MRKKRLIFYGMGGHARVLLDSLSCRGDVLGAIDSGKSSGDLFTGIPIIDEEAALHQYLPEQIFFVNAVGFGEDSGPRRNIGQRIRCLGYRFFTVIHPQTIVADDVQLDEGAQVMAGAILQSGVSIGQDSIVNTGARIDHDCLISDNCHICPGVVLAGTVVVESGTMIGTGTVVTPGITIGRESVIAAGSVIFRNVPPHSKVIQRRAEIPDNAKKDPGA
jgi:UDP-perosamine 4-acetyltransferase